MDSSAYSDRLWFFRRVFPNAMSVLRALKGQERSSVQQAIENVMIDLVYWNCFDQVKAIDRSALGYDNTLFRKERWNMSPSSLSREIRLSCRRHGTFTISDRQYMAMLSCPSEPWFCPECSVGRPEPSIATWIGIFYRCPQCEAWVDSERVDCACGYNFYAKG